MMLLAALVSVAVSACSAQPPRSDAVAQVTYSCCEAKDVDAPYRPGQTVTIHWTVNGSDEPGAIRRPVELAASLNGPFATVEQLKEGADDPRAASGTVTFTAAPVRPSGMPDEKPISVITIGSDAEPGYYHVTTSVTGAGSGEKVSGASIITVIPRA